MYLSIAEWKLKSKGQKSKKNIGTLPKVVWINIFLWKMNKYSPKVPLMYSLFNKSMLLVFVRLCNMNIQQYIFVYPSMLLRIVAIIFESIWTTSHLHGIGYWTLESYVLNNALLNYQRSVPKTCNFYNSHKHHKQCTHWCNW